MPNQRAPGQKPVIVILKEEFLDRIDASLGVMGFSDRSSFIRTAVLEKLQRLGHVSPSMAQAPSRAGKGGRPKNIVKIRQEEDLPLVAEDPQKPQKKKTNKQ